jgi:signal transduction histidine kinase
MIRMSRDTLSITDVRDSSSPVTFWGRQFADTPTRAQTVFDVCAGIILPVACLAFDPVVFRGGFAGGPLLGSFKLFAYALIAFEIAALAAWLALRGRAGVWAGVLGGVMAAGAHFSLVVGVVLLPFSLIGLMFLVGVLGFSPFLAALVYWRNGRRARRASAAFLTDGQRRWLPLIAGLLALALPAAAHMEVSRLVARSLPELAGGDAASAEAAAGRLRLLGRLADADLDQLVWAYSKEADAARRERLARAYRDATGRDIEHRLTILLD